MLAGEVDLFAAHHGPPDVQEFAGLLVAIHRRARKFGRRGAEEKALRAALPIGVILRVGGYLVFFHARFDIGANLCHECILHRRGTAGGFGRGFAANTQSVLQGSNVQVNGERQKLGAGELLEGGLGEGVATSADMVSKYLIERAEQYQPVIEMPTGIDVEIVFLEGVFISG